MPYDLSKYVYDKDRNSIWVFNDKGKLVELEIVEHLPMSIPRRVIDEMYGNNKQEDK